MKIRNGFVSNSSSTSFCIYGTVMDTYELENLITGSEDKTDEQIVLLAKMKLNDIDASEDIHEILENIASKYDLSHYTSDDGECFIGRDVTSIRDDETGKEFKESTAEKLKSIFGDKIELSWIEEVIYG